MLDNQVDNILIGSNYLSFLSSFNLLKNKKQVLVLDDMRSRYGELFADSLCQLEKDFLQIWGLNTGFFTSMDIDRYVTKKKLTLVMDHRRIRLGASPWQNYREIVRKLPFCFKEENRTYLAPIIGKKNQEKFDRNYFDHCHRLARNLWNLDEDDLSEELFLENCPEELMNIFQIFSASLEQKKIMKNEQREIINTFIYMARGYFHKILAVNADKMELFHLILSLLSPGYELDQDAFLSDVKKIYLEKGGKFRKTDVKQWYFDNSRPWRLELTSYEGVVCPQYISFFAGLPSGIPIDFGPFISTYTCVDVHWKLKKRHSTYWEEEKIFCSSIYDIGTNYPLWSAEFSPDFIKLKVFIENHLGNKISFVQKKIHQFLINRLGAFVTELEEMIENEKMSFNPEILTKAEVLATSRSSTDRRPMVISDISNPTKRVNLKNVDYFGPFKNGGFGLLSTLMELKKDHISLHDQKK